MSVLFLKTSPMGALIIPCVVHRKTLNFVSPQYFNQTALRMGVTIHFEGKLEPEAGFLKVMDIIKQFAISVGLPFTEFEVENKLLERVRDERAWDYNGPTKGICLQPDGNTDPLNLEFDRDPYIQEYCKTQFADIDVHILIIDLLRQIECYFERLTVEDEGEYWATNDKALLQKHLDTCFKAIEDAKKNDRSLTGPYRISEGRIVDLISQH
jgi:hypothetical protein